MRTMILAILTMLLVAVPASAQIELSTTAYADAVKLNTPDTSENAASLGLGLEAGFRLEPWSFSAEYAGGELLDLKRSWTELAVGYSVSDSVALTAGARIEDIRLTDTSTAFFFFFFPVSVTHERANVDLTNFFVGVNYESDPTRRAGVLGEARVYRGSADVRTESGRSVSDHSEGYRVELGVRLGQGNGAYILGAAYESCKLPDAGVNITSEPVVFLKYRWKLPSLDPTL